MLLTTIILIQIQEFSKHVAHSTYILHKYSWCSFILCKRSTMFNVCYDATAHNNNLLRITKGILWFSLEAFIECSIITQQWQAWFSWKMKIAFYHHASSSLRFSIVWIERKSDFDLQYGNCFFVFSFVTLNSENIFEKDIWKILQLISLNIFNDKNSKSKYVVRLNYWHNIGSNIKVIVFVEFAIFPLFKSRLHKIIRFILIILMVQCEKVSWQFQSFWSICRILDVTYAFSCLFSVTQIHHILLHIQSNCCCYWIWQHKKINLKPQHFRKTTKFNMRKLSLNSPYVVMYQTFHANYYHLHYWVCDMNHFSFCFVFGVMWRKMRFTFFWGNVDAVRNCVCYSTKHYVLIEFNVYDI